MEHKTAEALQLVDRHYQAGFELSEAIEWTAEQLGISRRLITKWVKADRGDLAHS
jgi:predicted transcriptional regulator YheO